MRYSLQRRVEFFAALGLYLFLFYAIFAVYYTSPLIRGTNLVPLNTTPLATHLIFMVTDGMRADKLFQSELQHTPFLRDILLKRGSWGLSHTRVPTESRPGHIAMLGGFYEDVASITKGWQANAVEFDSLLNRSRKAWAWGTHEVVHSFGLDIADHVITKSSPSELSDLTKHNISDIDRWTFDQFKLVLNTNKDGFFAESTPLSEQHLGHVAFLHFDAADLVGHAYKPHSGEYISLLHHLDTLIADVVQEVERASQGLNVRIAFILTADHGMTDWGSHGAGSLHETVTPLLVWGDGINGPKLISEADVKGLTSIDQYGIPQHIRGRQRLEIQQADLCPLMASLIGVPIPVNSVGRVPLELLNVNDSVKVKLIRANCLQLLAQLTLKREEMLRSHFELFFKEFDQLHVADITKRLNLAEILEQQGLYEQSIHEYELLADLTLAALRYYHTYDRRFLSGCIGVTFALWSLLILCSLWHPNDPGEVLQRWILVARLFITAILGIVGLLLSGLSILWPISHTLCQLVPLVLALYLLWRPSLHRTLVSKQVYSPPQSQVKPGASWSVTINFFRTVGSLCILECLIWGFHTRQLLSVACLVLAMWPSLDPSYGIGRKITCRLWSFSCFLLAVFPLLPVIGSFFQPLLVSFSGLILSASIALCFRWFASEASKFPGDRGRQLQHITLHLGYGLSLVTALASIAILLIQSFVELSPTIAFVIHAFSWSSLILPFAAVFVLPPRLGLRLVGWVCTCAIPFILLSTGYEIIFLGVFLLTSVLWIQLEAPNMNIKQLCFLETLISKEMPKELLGDADETELNFRNFRQSLFFILLLVLSFFGTGNIASVSSFDPRSTYCFITRLKPAVMAVFLILKILIPMLCLSAVYGAVQLVSAHHIAQHSAHLLYKKARITHTSICLILSNFIAAHFFVWLRDEGSWLEIGTSISHYVIAMGIGFVCFLFSSFGNVVLCSNTTAVVLSGVPNGARKFV